MRDLATQDAVLYRAYYSELLKTAFCLIGSRETAEDIVQDVFVRCSGRLEGMEDPAFYLRRAVVNATRSLFRRRLVAQRWATTVSAWDEMPNELVELRDVLMRLPVRQRSVVVLRYVVGLDDDEIAATLECSRSTVRSSARRGLGRLRKELTP